MNKAQCSLPNRNLCAPGGKVSALFVDLDGTCMACEPYFAAARARFGYLMQLHGFGSKSSIEEARTLYMSYMKANGVERDQMALAFADTYKRLCRKASRRGHKVKPLEETIGICMDIGNSPFFRTPELFPNCAPVLSRARHNFLMIGVTIGNREAQKHKVRQGGLDSVFDHLIITPYDNKRERVRDLIQDLNIDPRYSAFIGNSVKSDGDCVSETNFVLVPFEKGVFDTDEPAKGDEFEVFSVRDWRDVEERAIQRLIMRRDQAVRIEQHAETVRSVRPECKCGGGK